jgi:hypothetical protein
MEIKLTAKTIGRVTREMFIIIYRDLVALDSFIKAR